MGNPRRSQSRPASIPGWGAMGAMGAIEEQGRITRPAGVPVGLCQRPYAGMAGVSIDLGTTSPPAPEAKRASDSLLTAFPKPLENC